MEGVLGVLAPVFWGLLILSLLVFVHEGGHFLAARACGVRVTEFFLGFPCRFSLHRTSRRTGPTFGITPILLGGYAMICGMERFDDEAAGAVLSEIHREGSLSVAEISERCGIDEGRALDICVSLMGWGSLAPVYDPEKGESPNGKYYASAYSSVSRDAAGATLLDGKRFVREGATVPGEPWNPPFDDAEFLARERSRTYMGAGFWKRALMLVAGICVNVLTGLLLMVVAYSVIGYEVVYDENVLGGVQSGSIAESAGLEPGDVIVSLDGVAVDSWSTLMLQVEEVKGDGAVELVYTRDGERHAATVDVPDGEMLGIEARTGVERLSPIDSVRMAGVYIAETAKGVAQLLVPTQTMQVLDNSTSIVGISVMSAQAAAAGPTVLLTFSALISFSLAFMNLLPIPPLDGGKLLIEIVQAIIGRPVSQRVQTALSLAGVALFMLLFAYMLRADILRFF